MPAGWLVIVPIYNIYVMYLVYTGIADMQEVDGVPECDRVNPILLLILSMVVAGVGIILAQNALNAHWQKLSA